ncbi:hypothetical protein BGZ65_008866, partial [Modicella reniformis]
YDPPTIYLPKRPCPSGPIRVDLQACFFNLLRKTSTKPTDVAHKTIDRRLSTVVAKVCSVIYIDGFDVSEKAGTHAVRQAKREQAEVAATVALDVLVSRVEHRKRATRQQHITARKNIQKSFRLTLSARIALMEFLQQQGWTVVLGDDLEADIHIARDCGTNNVILTTDSDVLAYANINKVWRLVTNRKVLEYGQNDVCTILKLSNNHLTALAVVSGNDYESNIRGLGIATNLKLIRDIPG